MRLANYLLLLIGMTLIANTAYPKVIYEPFQNSNEVTIRIEDEITPKDLIDLKAALKQLDKSKKKLHMNSVSLESHGGNGETAEKIGRLIRARKLNTYLASDAECASACVLILISGMERYAFGAVRVHRSTFMYDQDKDDHVEKFISDSRESHMTYVKAMGISMMLADAINSTESWSIRQLTELEKTQWQVFGFDPLAVELYFNQTSRERKISRREFIHIFKSNYEDCLSKARDFKQSIFDCAKTKKLKDQSNFIKLLKWIYTKLDLDIDTENLSHHEQVENIRMKIRAGTLYERYTSITEVKDVNYISTKLKSVDAEILQKMEAANKWWVDDNTLSVLVLNPIDVDLKEVVFELSSTDCRNDVGKKRYFSLPLLAHLEAKNKAIYSGLLPFNYNNVIGKGTRCGVIKAAYSA